VELREGLAQVLFEHVNMAEAEPHLEAILALHPNDASAWLNLGRVRLRTGRFADAVESFRQSLRYRPQFADTHAELGAALYNSGRPEEAARAWEQALRLD